MRCERCGAPVTENQLFCPSCGMEIDRKAAKAADPEMTQPGMKQRNAEPEMTQPGMKRGYEKPTPQPEMTQPGMKQGYEKPAPQQTYETPQSAPTAPQPKKPNKGLLIGLLAGGLAIVAAVIVLLVLHPWSKDKNTKEADANPTAAVVSDQTYADTVDAIVETPAPQPVSEPEPETIDPETIPDTMASADGKYEIAFVVDGGTLKDHGYNQNVWEGCKLYAAANGKSYKYYQPANADQATDDDRYDAMKAAVDGGAKIVVCAGFMQYAALTKAAAEFPDVKFIFIDGWGLGLDNVADISYQEEQAGYLAGYAVVMEGYTKLGFCGGGGPFNSPVCRYLYGFMQGANAAAAAKNVTVGVRYSWDYGASFSASPELQTMAAGWYESGTEIIFACGGSMFQSVAEAAQKSSAKVVGVDVDQSYESDTVLTSAMKNFTGSVQWALSRYYDGAWNAMSYTLGAAEDGVCLPTETWSFRNWSITEYYELLEKMRTGRITVDGDYPKDADGYSFSDEVYRRFSNVQINAAPETESRFKVGFICLGDENSLSSMYFIDAAKAACDQLGVEYIIKMNIPEGKECYYTAADMAGSGCDIIFADSYGHESYMIQAAREYPDVQFCHCSGILAHTEGVPNYHNAYAMICEGRYLTGVAAGMKLNEMIADGRITADQAKLGYVGTFSFAEVISDYTAFYLGACSVCPTAVMEVTFTGSWQDETAEKESVNRLIENGCVLISQHSGSMSVPNACEREGVPNVACNDRAISACPNTCIISTRINWEPYYTYAILAAMNGEAIPADWTGTLETGSVELSELNTHVAAAGTQEAIDAAKAALLSGERHVFDTATFTADGGQIMSHLADVDSDLYFKPETEVVSDGYFHECEFRSAPYFDILIDGITLRNMAF